MTTDVYSTLAGSTMQWAISATARDISPLTKAFPEIVLQWLEAALRSQFTPDDMQCLSGVGQCAQADPIGFCIAFIRKPYPPGTKPPATPVDFW